MFKLPCCRRKKKTEKLVQNKRRPRSISSERLILSDAPAAKTPAAKCIGRTPWWYRLFGRPANKERSPKVGDESEQRSSPQQSKAASSHDPATTTTTAGNLNTEKGRLRCRVFDCCRRKHRVTPAADGKGEPKTPQKPHRSPVKATDKADKVVKFKAPAEEEEEAAGKEDKEKRDKLHILRALVHSLCQTLAKQDSNSAKTCQVTQFISSLGLRCQQDWLGFPNPAQICYMNSSLQSLITLADFIRDISCQEQVWTSVPEAELIRRFMSIVWCHRSMDSYLKLHALYLFKRALSVQAPEFLDHFQKDAHEFLTTVLDQIRGLSPLLREVTASVEKRYRCPVEDHLTFKMQNTRNCKRVLILHLKRFRFTPSLQLEKLSDPVDLFRELLVTSSRADGWYSLVSVISHLGSSGNKGHYVSNGVDPDVELDDPADRWLTYNDSLVTQTTGASVRKWRQETAYILFYQRRM
ncbi:ubiquitin carboxyl-terminal hydrolase 37-like isoform X2 [Micropterus dolomieu]|uniref:ubiquitin carboxyl-terminal hydrolase 37-like isoform X2 n=1 Tax=Micropterus dolomieu TaxID=147949 RepID=UPI001E8E1054|nr:ubiquitin carboxyl-terminal hydrolase 37-like isoform X2 [Micropterus dolomieu]